MSWSGGVRGKGNAVQGMSQCTSPPAVFLNSTSLHQVNARGTRAGNGLFRGSMTNYEEGLLDARLDTPALTDDLSPSEMFDDEDSQGDSSNIFCKSRQLRSPTVYARPADTAELANQKEEVWRRFLAALRNQGVTFRDIMNADRLSRDELIRHMGIHSESERDMIQSRWVLEVEMEEANLNPHVHLHPPTPPSETLFHTTLHDQRTSQALRLTTPSSGTTTPPDNRDSKMSHQAYHPLAQQIHHSLLRGNTSAALAAACELASHCPEQLLHVLQSYFPHLSNAEVADLIGIDLHVVAPTHMPRAQPLIVPNSMNGRGESAVEVNSTVAGMGGYSSQYGSQQPYRSRGNDFGVSETSPAHEDSARSSGRARVVGIGPGTQLALVNNIPMPVGTILTRERLFEVYGVDVVVRTPMGVVTLPYTLRSGDIIFIER